MYTRVFYCRLFTFLSGFNFFAQIIFILTPHASLWFFYLLHLAFSFSSLHFETFKWTLLHFSLCCWKSVHVTITAPGAGTQRQVGIRDLSDFPHGEADYVPVGTSWVSPAVIHLLCASSSYLQNVVNKKSSLIDTTRLRMFWFHTRSMVIHLIFDQPETRARVSRSLLHFPFPCLPC